MSVYGVISMLRAYVLFIKFSDISIRLILEIFDVILLGLNFNPALL